MDHRCHLPGWGSGGWAGRTDRSPGGDAAPCWLEGSRPAPPASAPVRARWGCGRVAMRPRAMARQWPIGRRRRVARRSAGWVASGAGAAIGSTSQNVGGQVGVVEQARRPASSRPCGAPRGARRARRRGPGHRRDPRARVASRTRGDAPHVERGGVPAARVVQVRPAAGHAGAEVRADRPEDDDRAAGHVLAAVRADPLDDRLGAAVADGEAHPGPADEVEPAAGRAVQHGVAGDRLATAASAARSGSGATVIVPPDSPLRDVVVGLARRGAARRPARRRRRRTGRRRRRSSSRIGPRSSPRSRAPVRPAPNDRSAVVTRSPLAVTGPWPRNAAAMPTSSADAGARPMSRPADDGSARRAGDRPPTAPRR